MMIMLLVIKVRYLDHNNKHVYTIIIIIIRHDSITAEDIEWEGDGGQYWA